MRQTVQGGCTQQSITKNKNAGYSGTGAVGLRNDKHKHRNKKCQDKQKTLQNIFSQINIIILVHPIWTEWKQILGL